MDAVPPKGPKALKADAEGVDGEMAEESDDVEGVDDATGDIEEMDLGDERAAGGPPVEASDTRQMVQDMLAEFRTDVMADASAAMGKQIVDTKVQNMVRRLGERMAGLEESTGRIEREAQRVEEANGNTEAKLDELMNELLALRMNAPPPRALARLRQAPGRDRRIRRRRGCRIS